MKFNSILKASLSRVFKSPIKCLALLLVVVVAMCFGLVTVLSFSKMPDAIKDFPIAVVNKDQGTFTNKEYKNYGDEILAQLKNNDSVAWEICDENTFEGGIEETKYYAAFVIPGDFSKKVMNAKGGTPTKADIEYLSDMRKNFLFSQSAKSIKSEFQTMIARSITDSYATAAFDSLSDVKDGMQDASEGSKKIEAASEKLSGGAVSLQEGSSALTTGTGGLKDAGDALAVGAGALNSKVQEINIAKVQLTKEQKKTISDKAAGAVSGYSEKLSSGIGTSVSNTIQNTLTSESTINSISAAMVQAPSVQKLMADLQSVGYTEQQAKQVVSAIVSSSMQAAASGVTEESITSAVSEPVVASLGQVAGGAAVSGAEAVVTQVNKTMDDYGKSFDELKTATGKLEKGTSNLAAGAGTLNEKMGTFNNGVCTMASGMSQMTSGAADLTKGLEDGVTELDVNLVNSSADMGTFISDPVGTADVIYGDVDSYSDGFAPLFMSLGLWVGALALFFVISSNAQKERNANSLQTVISVWMTAGIFGVLEAVGIVTGALFIGVEVTNILLLYLFAAFVSLVFISIIECFVMLFGLGGKVVGILITIFQIPSCGGTFPVEVMPEFFEVINPYLPLTYSIDGFREILVGGNFGTIVYDVGILCIFMAAFMGISIFFSKKSEKRIAFLEAEISK